MSTDDEDRDLLDGLDLADGVLTGAAFEVLLAGGTREQILEADRRERARWAELDEYDRRTAEARAQRQELKLREDQLRVADRIRRLRRREERGDT